MLTLLFAATLSWTMPTLYVDGRPLTRALRWEVAFTTQARSCRDSGLVWCREPKNMVVWIPEARTFTTLANGWAQPGERVSITAPPVSSLQWPFTWWVRACTDSCGRWSNPVTRADND